MKLRPLLVLLLFLVSAGLLVWIYYGATRAQQKPPEAPEAEVLADLHACSSRKHVKAAQYDHFARIAREEGDPEAASLFRAMAASERLNEQNCVHALTRLGGRYHPPMKVVVFSGKTDDNLDRSIAYQQQSLATQQGEEIRRAFDHGNRYAARVLIWAAANGKRQVALMKACRDHSAQNPEGEPLHVSAPQRLNKHFTQAPVPAIPDHTSNGFEFTEVHASQHTKKARHLVCPLCGNTYSAREHDLYCPFCLTDHKSFIVFE